MAHYKVPLRLETRNTVEILRLWRAFAAIQNGEFRNDLFWGCVTALETRGFVGDARRLLERAAPWSSHA